MRHQQRLAGQMLLAALFVLAVTGCVGPIQHREQGRSIGITSGSIGGHYHQCASLLAERFSDSAPNSRFHVFPSEGSFQNLDRLREGRTDLAIVQRDVLVARYYDKQKPFTEVEVLAPLFPEALQVLIHHDSLTGVVDYHRFARYVKTGRIEHMAIGPPGSVSNLTTRALFDVLGLEVGGSFYVQTASGEYLKEFEEGRIEAVAVLSAAPVTGFSPKPGFKLGLLSLTDDDVEAVTSYMRDLEPVTLPLDVYHEGDDRSFQTLGTWALLVGRNGISTELQQLTKEDPVNQIFTALEGANATFHQLFSGGAILKCERTTSGWRLWLTRAQSFEFFKGIGLAPGLDLALGRSRIRWEWKVLSALILVLTFTLSFVALVRRFGSDEFHRTWSRRWYRYQQFVYAGLIFVVIAAVLPPVIDQLERSFCARYGINSNFLDVSLVDKYIWLLVLSLSGNDNQLFPLSGWARVAASSSLVLQYVNMGYLAIHTLFKESRRRKRLNGEAMITYKNHIVICGWNDTASKLIKDLIADQYEYADDVRPIVLVHPKASKKLKADPMLNAHFEPGKVLGAVDDDSKKDSALEKCNIKSAHTAILLADSNIPEPDERTLLRALAIARSSRSLQGDGLTTKTYVIAEIADARLRKTFINNEVDEVVCSAELASNVLFQSSINHGISSVITELVDHCSGNEFYTIRVPTHGKLLNKTFDELLVDLRSSGVLLLGVHNRSVVEDANGEKSERRKRRLRTLFGKKGVNERDTTPLGGLWINPTDQNELLYRNQAKDELVVLAESKKVIDQLLQRP